MSLSSEERQADASAIRNLRRPLVCEFVGLPGAGKTTIAATVVEQLRARGWSCGERRGPQRGPGGRALSAIRKSGFHVLHPRHFVGALRFCCAVRPMTLATLSRAARLAHHGYALGRARDARLDPIVLDQGLVQELWSVILAGQRWSEAEAEHVVKRAVSAADVAPAFIYFDVSVEEAAARVRGRPSSSSRFDHLGVAESRRALAEGKPVLDRLFELAVAVTGAPWCRVDSTRSLQEVTSEVIGFIDARLGTERLAFPAARRC